MESVLGGRDLPGRVLAPITLALLVDHNGGDLKFGKDGNLVRDSAIGPPVEGQRQSVPCTRTFVSWEGYALNASAPRQRDQDGRSWVFSSWSDGGGKSHTITTPADPTTYVATFKRLRR